MKSNTGAWFDAMPSPWWREVAAHIAQPWPTEAAQFDLRYWQGLAVCTGAKRPGRRALADRWGWSQWQVRALIDSPELWQDQRSARFLSDKPGSTVSRRQAPPKRRPVFAPKDRLNLEPPPTFRPEAKKPAVKSSDQAVFSEAPNIEQLTITNNSIGNSDRCIGGSVMWDHGSDGSPVPRVSVGECPIPVDRIRAGSLSAGDAWALVCWLQSRWPNTPPGASWRFAKRADLCGKIERAVCAAAEVDDIATGWRLLIDRAGSVDRKWQRLRFERSYKKRNSGVSHGSTGDREQRN